MPLYDFEMGGKLIDPQAFYNKYLSYRVSLIHPTTFSKMVRTVETQICNQKPSQKSQLVWARCASLIGYQSTAPTRDKNHLWDSAWDACGKDGDECNKFVGSLIMWKIALIDSDNWHTSKTYDRDKFHPYRSYWINNNFPAPKATLSGLKAKWGMQERRA